MPAAPYPPLLSGSESLQASPPSPEVLRGRMAEVYGVEPACVLPVRGKWHGLALVLRAAVRDGAAAFAAPSTPEFERLASICGLRLAASGDQYRYLASPNVEDGAVVNADGARAQCALSRLVVVDEELIEFSDAESVAAEIAAKTANGVVLRGLSAAYGLAGEPCGALIACPALIANLEALVEPEALSSTAISTALSVLDPSKAAAYARRFAEVRAEKRRVAGALALGQAVTSVAACAGPFVSATLADPARAAAELRRFRADADVRESRLMLRIGAPAANDRALAALGVDVSAAQRRAEVVRETLETRIVAAVELDREGASDIDTGVGFYDHMLSQVAAHGGFSIFLRCEGDLEIDAHHTIEDCALALGQALKQALGDRRGIGRFGFVLPMDEAEARVSIDLGGRPYLVFEGAFSAPLIGAYPVEMTEHVFRSLSQTMGASIHVSVVGENDHHKTEACFKAFGRALRQAVRIEGQALPSTKGVIA